jgi:hypothetical protein
MDVVMFPGALEFLQSLDEVGQRDELCMKWIPSGLSFMMSA